MDPTTLKSLLTYPERSWLEFKYKWYWENNKKDTKNNGELLKDFSSLFNTVVDDGIKRYLIIGFDEKKKVFSNYNIDQNNEKIECFNDLITFKKELVSSIKRNFKNRPVYKSQFELHNIEAFFSINVAELDGYELLVITFNKAPYLLELKKVLPTQTTSYKENIILTRVCNESNTDPAVVVASHDHINHSLEIIKTFNDIPERDTTIKKCVELFKAKYMTSANVDAIAIEKDYTSGLRYEVFIVEGRFTPAVQFIYFTKHTIQQRSFRHIKENGLIKDCHTIILVDNENKTGGSIDKNRIKQLFQETIQSSDIDVYTLEEFSQNELCTDLFDPQIFHQGNFDITGFVPPYSNISQDKTADIIISEWFEETNSPLLVIKGAGGIGKTTTIKHFLDNLCKQTSKTNKASAMIPNVLFIDSHELINEMLKSSKVDDLFDFYQALAEYRRVQNRFNKEQLELSIDHGQLIIAIDGIDEVIAKAGDKFDINKLVSSIFEIYSENLAKTKIIITCRDYFWNEFIDQKYNITQIQLAPFDEELTLKYFDINFNGDKSASNKAMTLASKFAREVGEKKGGGYTYIPYILDMIKDNLLDPTQSDKQTPSIYINNHNINDYLIRKVCEREIIKLDNLKIDLQIKAMIELATKYNGCITREQLPKLFSNIDRSIDGNVCKKFIEHPLLVDDKKTLRFRYDFFSDHFKCMHLIEFMKKDEWETIPNEIEDILIHNLNYDNEFKRELDKRIEFFNVNCEKFIELSWMYIYQKNSSDEHMDISLRRVLSSLFLLSLSIKKTKDIQERTDFIRWFFEKDSHNSDQKNLSNINIINIHVNGNIKPTFDFSDFKISNSHFENYDLFGDCTFSDDTYFKNSTFRGNLVKHGVNPSFTRKNFDNLSCDIKDIIPTLDKIDDALESNERDIRKNVKRCLKIFWGNGAFKQRLASEVTKKMNKSPSILASLISKKIILTTKITSSQKNNDLAYYINQKYSNLRKVMEENDSCLEFEEVMRLIEI
ncbi:hypothetical protein RI537_07105 [Aeromonas salmonicida]|uniref:hypothetical protein n=1 Tax=Aeromonas salmonicida TaxID=645 RepID=UPI0034384B7D